MSRPRDYAYEALAEVTHTDMNAGRGQLNAALKSIREQSPIEDTFALAAEIHERALMYGTLMPDVLLTAPALAKHWKRVKEETKKNYGVNLSAEKRRRYPPQSREVNLMEAQKLMETMGWRNST